jgi:hypothetical protein
VGTNPVRELMNQQIDYAISIIPEISSMFRNPHADLSSLKITTQSDFILGAVWASCNDYFIDAFRKLYLRRPTNKEHEDSILVLFERGHEIRAAIHEKTGL